MARRKIIEQCSNDIQILRPFEDVSCQKVAPYWQDEFDIILTLYNSLFKKGAGHCNWVKTIFSLRGPYK
jgi:hypothetical protein